MIELNRKTIVLLVAMPTTAILLYWLIKTSREGITGHARNDLKSVEEQ